MYKFNSVLLGSRGCSAGGAEVEQTLVLVLSEPLLRRVDGHVVVIAAHRQMRLGEDKEGLRWSEDVRTWVHVNVVLGAIPIHTEYLDLFFL